MLNRSITILYVGNEKEPEIDLHAYVSKFVELGEDTFNTSVELIYKVIVASTVEHYIETINDINPDFYIMTLDDGSKDKLVTYCQIAKSHNPYSFIMIFQNDSDDAKYDSVKRSLWGLSIEDYLSVKMEKYERFARLNSAIRSCLTLHKYQTLSLQLHEMTLIDNLTGLSNMRSFYIGYKKRINSLKNNDKENSLAIYMIDLDKFKKVNDNNNHMFGSYILSQVGKLMKHGSMFPKDSLMARYGGDEFVWAINVDSAEEAFSIAERWLQVLKSSFFKKMNSQVQFLLQLVFVFWKGSIMEILRNLLN